MTIKDWTLAGSFLINVMLLAFIATNLYRAPIEPSQAGFSAPFDRLEAVEDLPPEERDMVRQIIREAIPDLRRQRARARAAFFDLQDAISADPFDPEAVTEAANRLSDARQAQWRSASEVYVEVLSSMSDEARASVIQSREASAQEMRERRQNRLSDSSEQQD